MGGPQGDYGTSIAVDGSGNVYMTGHFYGAVDLGGGSVTSKGSHDAFVTSFTSSGVHRWQKAMGGTSNDYGQGVAVDGSGNVYLTGRFHGAADLGGGSVTSKGSHDIFVTSFTAAGVHRWQKALGAGLGDFGEGVAVDKSGNVYFVGTFIGDADLGGGNVAPIGSTDIFVTSFTSSGAHRWQKALGGTSSDYGLGVAVDGSGNVYLTGRFNGTADLGGGSVTSKGSSDIFVTSFTSGGAHRWQKALGGTSDDFGQAVAVDGSGNVYLTGRIIGAVDLGGGSVAPIGSYDIFVTSFTSGGVHRWQKALGGTSDDFGYGVGADSSGNIYLVGNFNGAADLGGGNVVSIGTYDAFVTSFTSSGVHRWQKTLGGKNVDNGRNVAVDGSAAVYLTGSFSLMADLGAGNVTSKGSADIFLVKLGP